MKSKVAVSVLALVSAVLVGCPPPQELNLYNNTGDELFVLVGDDRIPWKAGGLFRIGGDGSVQWADLKWVEDEKTGVRDRQLEVEWNGERLIYALAIPGLTGEFLDRSTGLYRRALQLQPDRKLYAIHVRAERLADQIPEQPDGLPLAAAHQQG